MSMYTIMTTVPDRYRFKQGMSRQSATDTTYIQLFLYTRLYCLSSSLVHFLAQRGPMLIYSSSPNSSKSTIRNDLTAAPHHSSTLLLSSSPLPSPADKFTLTEQTTSAFFFLPPESIHTRHRESSMTTVSATSDSWPGRGAPVGSWLNLCICWVPDIMTGSGVWDDVEGPEGRGDDGG